MCGTIEKPATYRRYSPVSTDSYVFDVCLWFFHSLARRLLANNFWPSAVYEIVNALNKKRRRRGRTVKWPSVNGHYAAGGGRLQRTIKHTLNDDKATSAARTSAIRKLHFIQWTLIVHESNAFCRLWTLAGWWPGLYKTPTADTAIHSLLCLHQLSCLAELLVHWIQLVLNKFQESFVICLNIFVHLGYVNILHYF